MSGQVASNSETLILALEFTFVGKSHQNAEGGTLQYS